MHRALAILLFSLPALGATYYIDATGGSDSANGTSTATAWKTLGHATNATYQLGDTVLLKRGETWNETFTFPTNSLTLDAYGTGALPILDEQGVRRFGVYVTGVSNTITRNLYIKNGGGSGTGANWQMDTGTNTLTDCVLDHHEDDDNVAINGGAGIVQRCTIINAADQGVTMHGTGVKLLIESCTISNCLEAFKNSGTSMSITANGITMVNNGGDVDDLTDCPATFSRCQFLGRSDGTTWAFFKANTSQVSFNYCTFDGSRSSGGVAAPQFVAQGPTFINNCVFYGGGNGNMVVNAGQTLTATNCIFSSWWRAAFVDTGGAFNADHCIFNAITTGTRTSTHQVSTSDPLFVSAGSDFHLQAASPAVASGIAIGLTLDLGGINVRNPPAVGAYEYPPYNSGAFVKNAKAGAIRGK